MDLNDFFGPNPNVIDLRAENRWEAIQELIDHLVANQKIKAEHKDAIAQSVRKRESSMSTGVGFGIGIPHTSTPLVSELVAILGRSRMGIQFDALDKQPVKLVMLFLVPKGQFQKHAQMLANITKLLHRPDFRKWLSDTEESE
jgi:mannitol/fructose-specific phosphotransferase system IIA component (Ntr-type)